MRRTRAGAMPAFIVCLQCVAYQKMLTDGPLSAPRHYLAPSTALGIRLLPFLVPEVSAFGAFDSASVSASGYSSGPLPTRSKKGPFWALGTGHDEIPRHVIPRLSHIRQRESGARRPPARSPAERTPRRPVSRRPWPRRRLGGRFLDGGASSGREDESGSFPSGLGGPRVTGATLASLTAEAKVRSDACRHPHFFWGPPGVGTTSCPP